MCDWAFVKWIYRDPPTVAFTERAGLGLFLPLGVFLLVFLGVSFLGSDGCGW